MIEEESGLESGNGRMWLIAAAALAALLVVAYLIVGTGQDRNQDRLSDTASSANGLTEPEKLCASQSVHDAIKEQLFARAAQVRGSDSSEYRQMANYAAIRMEAVILTSSDNDIGRVECRGTAWLDLPPGILTATRRTAITSDIGYTVEGSDAGDAALTGLSGIEGMISSLSTLILASDEDEMVEDVIEPGTDPLAPLAPEVPSEPQGPMPPEAPSVPEPPRPSAGARPSYDCGNARTRSEIAVCNDSGLAALDRQMASQFNRALSGAGPQERALLLRTRDSFLNYRDQCPNNRCIAQTYRGRMREIGDIMSGRWQPQR